MLEDAKIMSSEIKDNKSFYKKSDCCRMEDWQSSLRRVTQIVYICQALSFLLGVTAVTGVVINYFKRSEVRGTWLESHFVWQIKTFWFGLLFGVLGWLLTSILIGFLVLAINLVWVIYRIIKGWLLLYESKIIEDSHSLI